EAIRKAGEHATKAIILVPLRDTTIPCEITAHSVAVRLFLTPPVAATGVVAGAAVRATLVAAAVQGLFTTTHGPKHPHNALQVTLDDTPTVRGLIAKAPHVLEVTREA